MAFDGYGEWQVNLTPSSAQRKGNTGGPQFHMVAPSSNHRRLATIGFAFRFHRPVAQHRERQAPRTEGFGFDAGNVSTSLSLPARSPIRQTDRIPREGPPMRRFLRFSIRDLLWLTLVVAVKAKLLSGPVRQDSN